jgi:hypothetical protein
LSKKESYLEGKILKHHPNTLLCQKSYWDGDNLGLSFQYPSLPNDLLGWEKFRVIIPIPFFAK